MGYLLRLAASNLAGSPGRRLLVGLGVAAGAAVLGASLAGSVVAADAKLSRTLGALPPAERSVHVAHFGIARDRASYGDLDRSVEQAVGPLQLGRPVRVLQFKEADVGGGLTILAAIDDAERWVQLRSGTAAALVHAAQMRGAQARRRGARSSRRRVPRRRRRSCRPELAAPVRSPPRRRRRTDQRGAQPAGQPAVPPRRRRRGDGGPATAGDHLPQLRVGLPARAGPSLARGPGSRPPRRRPGDPARQVLRLRARRAHGGDRSSDRRGECRRAPAADRRRAGRCAPARVHDPRGGDAAARVPRTSPPSDVVRRAPPSDRRRRGCRLPRGHRRGDGGRLAGCGRRERRDRAARGSPRRRRAPAEPLLAGRARRRADGRRRIGPGPAGDGLCSPGPVGTTSLGDRRRCGGGARGHGARALARGSGSRSARERRGLRRPRPAAACTRALRRRHAVRPDLRAGAQGALATRRSAVGRPAAPAAAGARTQPGPSRHRGLVPRGQRRRRALRPHLPRHTGARRQRPRPLRLSVRPRRAREPRAGERPPAGRRAALPLPRSRRGRRGRACDPPSRQPAATRRRPDAHGPRPTRCPAADALGLARRLLGPLTLGDLAPTHAGWPGRAARCAPPTRRDGTRLPGTGARRRRRAGGEHPECRGRLHHRRARRGRR